MRILLADDQIEIRTLVPDNSSLSGTTSLPSPMAAKL
jgi:hypothetical protein